MSEIRSGVVQYVNEKDTRVGKTYNIRLDGDEVYYGCYKSHPGVVVGQYVTFECSKNGAGFTNIDMKKGIKVEEATAAPVETATTSDVPPAAPSGNAAAALKKAANKELKLTWQAARNTAAAVMGVAATADALDLGAKKAGKFDALLIQFNELTLDMYNDAVKLAETGENPFEGDI